jgi:hypothetical protein
VQAVVRDRERGKWREGDGEEKGKEISHVHI